MRVTIYDVAREAGVSLATVSRVLNNNPHVRPATRQRVQEAIERLHFQPNLVASALMTKRTGLVALLVPDIANPTYAEIAGGVQDAAAELNYQCVVCSVGDDRARQAESVGVLRRKGIEGVVLALPAYDEALLADLRERGYPFVLVVRDAPSAEVNHVLVDDGAGGALAARHLLELGHQRFALVAEPEPPQAFQPRVRGFAQALQAAGFDVTVLEAEGSDIAAGVHAGERLLEISPRPTAVFAASDRLAVGVLRAARRANVEVPAELSVVGFDGSAIAEATYPPLTTVVRPLRAAGRAALRLLVETLQGQPPRGIVMAPALRVAGTTAPRGEAARAAAGG